MLGWAWGSACDGERGGGAEGGCTAERAHEPWMEATGLTEATQDAVNRRGSRSKAKRHSKKYTHKPPKQKRNSCLSDAFFLLAAEKCLMRKKAKIKYYKFVYVLCAYK